MVQEIIGVLGQSNSGVTLQELARALGRGTLIEIQKCLGDLQKKKIARFERDRWILLGARAPIPSRSPSPQGRSHKSAPRTLRGIEAVALRASRYSTPTRAKNEIKGSNLESRALLRYYRNCLSAEEKADASADIDEENTRYLTVRLDGPWWPTSQELSRFTIARTLLPTTFQQAMGRAKNECIIQLGYPLEVFRTQDNGFMVRAIASLPLKWRAVENDLIEFEPIDTALSVNPSWIAYHLKSFDFFRLLRRLGAEEGDESTEEMRGTITDLPDLCVGLNLAFAQKRLAEIDPNHTASALLRDGGIQNAAALFVVGDARFSAGAIRDLTELGKQDDHSFNGTALNTLLGSPPPKVSHVPAVIEPLPLTYSQLTAVRSGLSNPLTVITGPPGTGKSQVVVAILVSAALAGKSVLFASRNHAALDAVEDRLKELVPDRPLLLRLNQRWGQGQAVRLQSLISRLVSKPMYLADRQSLDLRVSTLGTLDLERVQVMKRASELATRRDEVAALEDELQCHLVMLGIDAKHVSELPRAEPAFGAATNGRKGIWIILWRLWNRLRRLGNRAYSDWLQAGCPDPKKDREQFKSWRQALYTAQSLVKTIPRTAHAFPTDQEQARAGQRLEELSNRIQTDCLTILTDFARALDSCDDSERARLIELRGQSSEKRLGSEAIRLLLRHYPLWACSNLAVSRFAALQMGLFDYLVVDEASQCDIASAIPLLARAKYAVIVGDPAQLTMISHLSPEWEAETLNNLSLNDKPGIGRFLQSRNSLFDLASTVPAASRHLLTDHFRCHSEIADYVSGFYNGQISIATDESRLQVPRGARPGLTWEEAVGPIVAASGGGCHAPAEASAIVYAIEELLIAQKYTGTVGVCSPFREQARRIGDLIAERIPAPIVDRARLASQTANGFQGDARDVIFVTLCLGPDTPPGSLSFVREGANLLNVAISRAKAVCRVFGNKEFASSCGISHITRLANACDRDQRTGADRRKFESPWEERLFAALQAKGIECVPQFPVAGRRLDLAWFNNVGVKLDIEVDGDRFHRDVSGLRKIDDLWRDHQLRSAGWRVLRFWVYQLREDMNGAVERIRQATQTAN